MARWTQDEIHILHKYYVGRGSRYCSQLLDRSPKAVSMKANKLGLLSRTVRNGVLQKQIIDQLPNGRVMAECRVCGLSPHYVLFGKIQHCVRCKLVSDRNRNKTNRGRQTGRRKAAKYRSTIIGKYADRLRASLNQGMRKYLSGHANGCFRYLPYDPKQLCEHLESVRSVQNNRCPVCCRSYDIVEITIDHIVPVKTASTMEEILRLFELSNLSLLCRSCNSSKGDQLWQ